VADPQPVRSHRIAVIGGDGVGPEVIEAGLRVIDAAVAMQPGLSLDLQSLPWGSEHYHATGRMMPPDGLDVLRGFDSIYLGAVGMPSVPDHVSLWGLLLPIRQTFDLYVNLRPIKLMEGVECPLRGRSAGDFDFVCVRENSEGEYSGVGGRVHRGMTHEVGLQTDVFTRHGVERIVRYAFEVARTRRRKLTSITKSNAGRDAYVFWDDVAASVASDYPDVEFERVLVDAAAAYFVSRPESFDVVVGSNLFIDILTDLGAALQGGMGMAASANFNPEGGVPSMFEPVHGSAPDIAGRGVANPSAAVWAGAMMLEHLGETAAAGAVLAALEAVLAEREIRTPDLGGDARTAEMADAMVEHVKRGRAGLVESPIAQSGTQP
jgi:tartrate dehydrogenase/decarboxylase/D-malate dehydrogenase